MNLKDALEIINRYKSESMHSTLFQASLAIVVEHIAHFIMQEAKKNCASCIYRKAAGDDRQFYFLILLFFFNLFNFLDIIRLDAVAEDAKEPLSC